ncbi:hypothetical protein [Serratia proteamaculans]|uniref:hypothetical protein n=1 Tax=Serratia proteamaculans TaxID=28151 RepID=UPI00217AC417|nr:hypothetical protein [Serratia proteamaculans]CAI0854114.1 Uncharacterised protein [Serratia proteamaculans]CAI2076842.1 Uncharacterised protein [Serratia proteamaculans]
MKLTSLMTAALALLASSCCYSFVDKHAQRPGFQAGESAVDYRLRFNGLLQHLWYVEQIRSEQAQLTALRAKRKALESAIRQRECEVATVSSSVDQRVAGTPLDPRVN